ncbi:MAG TPA: hypothetical protein VN622_11000 [Clostridia bacterium]|nr:hypothetical protein [Clostridia bacterium]
MNLKDLILSKRVVGVAVGLLLRVLAQHGVIVPDETQEDLVAGLIDVLTALWVIVTKILDQRRAQRLLQSAQ